MLARDDADKSPAFDRDAPGFDAHNDVGGGAGTIAQVISGPADAQHLHELARLRRVRDRIDREYAQPLDVEALARGVAC